MYSTKKLGVINMIEKDIKYEQIRVMLVNGMTYNYITDKLGVSKSTISNVKKKMSGITTPKSKSPESKIKGSGIRFYSWLGQQEGIVNYSTMNVSMLKVNIAIKWLIECTKNEPQIREYIINKLSLGVENDS